MAGGDWTPDELPTAQKGFWVNANSISGGNGDAIASFQDDFGNVTFANATASQQPQVETDSLNGLKAIKWVLGSGDDNLSGTWSDGANIGTGDVFMIGLCSHDGSFDNNPTMAGVSFSNGPNQRYMIQRRSADDKFQIFAQQTVSKVSSSFSCKSDNAVSDNTPVIAGAVRTTNGSSTTRLYLDGTAQTETITTAVNLTNSAVKLGSEAGQFGSWSGRIYEVIVGRGTLTDENRLKLEGYLAWRYGLQANLPNAHTYRFHKPTIEPKRWQGGVNGVMTNALNWSSGSVPTARDKVLFDAEYRSNTITGSLTAGSVFVTPNFDGKIGTSESPATFTAESIVLGSDEADLNLQLASNTQTFVTSSTNGVKLTGTGTNIFLRSKSPTTLALSNDNTMTIDARHPSGAGGLVSHESGTPLLTRVGFGGALEHSFAGGLDTVEITGNGNYRHTAGAMPAFFLRGGEVVFDGETLSGVSDLLGGVFTLRDSSQPTVELGVIRVYPGGVLDLTGTATGQVDFGSSKVLTSQGGSKLRLGQGRSVAMS